MGKPNSGVDSVSMLLQILNHKKDLVSYEN